MAAIAVGPGARLLAKRNQQGVGKATGKGRGRGRRGVRQVGSFPPKGVLVGGGDGGGAAMDVDLAQGQGQRQG